jgi:hypothetical protein
VIQLGQDNGIGKPQMRSEQINLKSQSVMADVCLGVAVTGLYTLVGMGLIIVFM